MKKIILCVALTGSIVQKSQNSNLPTSPEEIIDAAYECYAAGAALVHLHVRNKDGSPSLNYDLYEEIIEGIRKKCDVLICISTSNYGIDISDERRYELYNLNTDLASLSFGNVIRAGGSIVNSTDYIDKSLEIMYQKGIKPEIEIFSKEMLENCKKYYQLGRLEPNPYIQLIFGSPGGMSFSYQNIFETVAVLPKEWLWASAGISKGQLPTNVFAMLNEGHVIRTGLEDNIYYAKHVLAESNAQLVKRLVRLVDEFNCEIANVQEAGLILGIKRFQA